MLCYISHPYSNDDPEQVTQNVKKAMDISIDLWLMGLPTICPLLSHFIEERAVARGIDISWSDYLEWDLILLEKCDALLLLGDSPGCVLERERAKELELPIFVSVEEVRQWARAQALNDLAAQAQQLSFGY